MSPLSDRRILRSNSSLLSLASSLSSLYTSTFSSTQWGPGALAERLIILRRLATIRAHLPRLDEEKTEADAYFMEGIFGNLMDLSRGHLDELVPLIAETMSVCMFCRSESAFALLSTPPPELSDLWMETLERYWPLPHTPSLEGVVEHINRTSPNTWLILAGRFLQREAQRLVELAMPLELKDELYPRWTGRDLKIQLPGLNAVSYHALWSFLRCLAFGGDVTGIMSDYLRHSPRRFKVSFLSQMMNFLLPNTTEALSKDMKTLCTLIGNRQRLTDTLTNFLLTLVASDDEFKLAVLDASIITIIPLLTPEINSWAIYEDVFRRSHFFPSIKRRHSYSKQTLGPFSIIRANALASVVG
ncbi:hypothetical protein DFH09DRAFT_1102416 [Mycena vulgaris]|nr:hypothetical protein DFH09DRAFT_1102416 [Mycena vulgaris]